MFFMGCSLNTENYGSAIIMAHGTYCGIVLGLFFIGDFSYKRQILILKL